MTPTNLINDELRILIKDAYNISADLGKDVESILGESTDQLTKEQAYSLLSRILERIQRRANKDGDNAVELSLPGPISQYVNVIVERREQYKTANQGSSTIELISHNSIDPRPVKPDPVFLGTPVPVMEGYVHLSEIDLWEKNERLEIHLQQFQKEFGRSPNPEELLSIMLSKLPLKGIPTGKDAEEFEIPDLARSIATNGVRVRPIIDRNGTLLDGNRRITACNYILHSSEFTQQQKQSVQYVKVWQLTDHATDAHREAVVVSLNFEKDHKKEWPAYIRARKVYDAYQKYLQLEPNPTKQRELAIRKEVSLQFALGPEPSIVSRAIRMVQWADDFEHHQSVERLKDEYTVKHRANMAFEYFDELSKGPNPGGVAYTLNHDDTFKDLVFDLLFLDRFRSFKQIRDLKSIAVNEEARKHIFRAREEPDQDEAKEIIDLAIGIVRVQNADARQVGVDSRIETFVKFMSELPLATLTSATSVKEKNLMGLLAVLRMAEGQAMMIYGDTLKDKVDEAARNLR